MRLDRTKVYIFMLRDCEGVVYIGVRRWNGRAWKTTRSHSSGMTGRGKWRVRRRAEPFWRRGPRMVLEVPA